MASKATYLTVNKYGMITIGAATYEKAGSPQWLRPEWNGQQVILWKAEQPEKQRTGTVKVRDVYPYIISAKPLIADAGLVEGRYRPTLVSRTRIVFDPVPYWTPDQPEPTEDADAAL